MADGSFCRVHCRVRAETQLGQTVAIALSSTDSFDKNSVVETLVTTPDAYPVWYTKTPLVVPSAQTAYYKYCVLEGTSISAFEGPTQQSRVIQTNAKDNMDIVLEDIFTGSVAEKTKEDESKNLLKKLSQQKRTEEDMETNPQLFSITGGGRLFITCYHLPISVKRQDNRAEPFLVTWGESLIAKSSDSVASNVVTFWVGTVTVPGQPPSEAEKVLLTEILAKMNCVPIYLDEATAKAAYQGFCKEVMWPIFHNVDQLDHIHAAWNLPKAVPAKGGLAAAAAASAAMAPVSAAPEVKSEVKWKGQEDAFYAAYASVSSTFDQVLGTLIKKADVVWVHDYHLMSLPLLLRNRGLDIKICFFLHIPFPTSQIFRSLPKATELLQSMVAADIIGFHAFDHTRHFLNAAKRILGVRSKTLDGGMLALFVHDRRVIVTMSHVSIEPDMLDKALLNAEVATRAAAIRAKYKDKKIIVGVDVCHRLSGVSLKLAAFEKLIGDYPSDRSGVVLIQRCLRPGAREKDEETTSSDLRRMVDHINAKFSNDDRGGVSDKPKLPVIDYEEMSSVSLAERLSLWLAADVFLLTCIREGLNLMPCEYIYSRKALDSAGVVVASEFSTCSSLLSGSIRINPFNALSVADALDKALNMKAVECNQRRTRDIQFVSTHPSSLWTKQILSDLSSEDDTRKDKKRSVAHAPLQSPVDVPYLVDCCKAAVGSGLSQTATRVFIFDYGGTLLFKEKFDVYIKQTLSAISGRKPSPRVMDAITKLSNDPNNVVMIMTGLTRIKLGDTFYGNKNLTLVTSNGLVYSWGENLLTEDERREMEQTLQTSKSGGDLGGAADGAFPDDLFSQVDDEGRSWANFDFKIDWNAVCKIAVPIMSKYTFRTNGTCLSPRIPGAGWSYFGADPDWGEKQAHHLRIDLEAALAKHDIKVVSQIQGSIELAPNQLQKGVMVERLFQKILQMRAGRLPAFTLIIGDETSDDPMFQAMFSILAASTPFAGFTGRQGGQKSFMVTVGKRESPAPLFLNDVDEVEELLVRLAAT